jgi:hypothetical protein
LLAALIVAPACGGGGSGSASASGSPSPLSASFTPDQPSPGAKNAAMAQGATSNDVVTVNVTLTSTTGVYGTAFDVTYDSTHTVFLGFAPGTLFEQGGNAPNYQVTANPSSNPAHITVGVSRTGSTTANATGTQTVIGLQFRVKQAGVYPLAVPAAMNPVVYDGQSTPQPIQGIAWFAGAVSGV